MFIYILKLSTFDRIECICIQWGGRHLEQWKSKAKGLERKQLHAEQMNFKKEIELTFPKILFFFY